MTLRSWTLPVLFCVACGGAAPSPTTPTTAGSSSPTPSASAAPDAPPGVSVVRFDDLGVSLTVPPGFHVEGDDELAARIRSTANPKLTAALQSRGSQKKGVPLLTLKKENTDAKDGLTITLTAAMVPKDASAAELLTQQQAVMKDNLDSFAITDGPKDHPQDGVPGLELSDTYGLRGGTDVRKEASMIRLHVRSGIAFMTTAVWPQTAPTERAAEARTMLDGLKFYAPQP